jgi:hypothetical protein
MPAVMIFSESRRETSFIIALEGFPLFPFDPPIQAEFGSAATRRHNLGFI